MKKFVELLLVVGIIVLGIGFVKTNDCDFRHEIGNTVVEIDLSDGVSFDVHEKNFMDHAYEGLTNGIESASEFVNNVRESLGV